MNGELLSGIICKKTIGSSSGSLLHLVWLDSGPEWCRNVGRPSSEMGVLELVSARNGMVLTYFQVMLDPKRCRNMAEMLGRSDGFRSCPISRRW